MDLILLILVIVYPKKRDRIAALSASNFPNVPQDQFEHWKRLELLSYDIVIRCGIIWIAVEVIGFFIVGHYVFSLAVAALPVLLILLGVSAVYGSKAAKIKKAHGIVIQKQQREPLVEAPYQGPQCVACAAPIEAGVKLCHKCGWTQPG